MGSTVTLPWPSKVLSPNARVHWTQKSRAVKRAREVAFWLTREAKPTVLPGPNVKITFHPPDKKLRDKDNMIGSFKSFQDGIADAIGIDDYEWHTRHDIGRPVKGGEVVVEFIIEKETT